MLRSACKYFDLNTKDIRTRRTWKAPYISFLEDFIAKCDCHSASLQWADNRLLQFILFYTNCLKLPRIGWSRTLGNGEGPSVGVTTLWIRIKRWTDRSFFSFSSVLSFLAVLRADFQCRVFSTVTDLFQKFDSQCANSSPNIIRASSKLQSNQARKEDWQNATQVTCFSHIIILSYYYRLFKTSLQCNGKLWTDWRTETTVTSNTFWVINNLSQRKCWNLINIL